MASEIDVRPALARPVAGSFRAALLRSGRMRPVDPYEIEVAARHWNRHRERLERKVLRRARWWYPPMLVLLVVCGLYTTLRLDQRLAALLIWPNQGARFAEVGDSRTDGEYRSAMVIVAGGLNRKSGTLMADALLPSLGGGDTRVFSLVYGNGIFDDDIAAKFDALYERYRPERLVLFGSSMGGDVVMGLASHFFLNYTDPALYPEGDPMPVLDAIFLDCSPLSTADVRYTARARADVITGVSEKVGTDGGAGVRLLGEMLAQRKQWSTGHWPFITIKPYDLGFKWREVWREKLNPSGVSTSLVKDQYGVIRRFDADQVLATYPPGTDVVYLRPAVGEADNTIDVQQVETRLRDLAARHLLHLTVIDIPNGSHASAVRDQRVYNPMIAAFQVTERLRETFVPGVREGPWTRRLDG